MDRPTIVTKAKYVDFHGAYHDTFEEALSINAFMELQGAFDTAKATNAVRDNALWNFLCLLNSNTTTLRKLETVLVEYRTQLETQSTPEKR